MYTECYCSCCCRVCTYTVVAAVATAVPCNCCPSLYNCHPRGSSCSNTSRKCFFLISNERTLLHTPWYVCLCTAYYISLCHHGHARSHGRASAHRGNALLLNTITFPESEVGVTCSYLLTNGPSSSTSNFTNMLNCVFLT